MTTVGGRNMQQSTLKYNTINKYIYIYTYALLVVFFVMFHHWVVMNILKILKRVPFVLGDTKFTNETTNIIGSGTTVLSR